MMTRNKKKALFMGTPDFAVPCLKKLCEMERLDVIGVVTQPDRPRGRGKKLTPSPVKECAAEKNIPVYQPEKVRTESFIEELRKISPDIIVVVAFGQILPKDILDIPGFGCVNVHASLLPAYRGAAPMQRCIMNGELKTGVTTMMMDVGLDTGDILEQAEIDITRDMTLAELSDKLSMMGADLLVSTVNNLIDGKVTPKKQDNSSVAENARYSPMIDRETGHIDFSMSAKSIHDLCRALDSVPGAFASVNGEKHKIWKTIALEDNPSCADKKNGEIISVSSDGIAVKTGMGIIEIKEIQAPGKKRMSAGDYLRGHSMTVGDVFV